MLPQTTTPDPARVLEMLQRYIRPWKTGAVLYGPSTKADIMQAGLDISGSLALRYKSVVQPSAYAAQVRRVQQMAVLPQFYRLNYIRQLANTNVAVNLEGCHNRLSHCLGTLDVAACFLDRLQPTLPEKLTVVEVKAILVYAFVHDCFHGPMGHTLDLIRDVLWGSKASERIDKHLLKNHAASKAGFLWDAVLAHVADSEEECSKIFQKLQDFLSFSRRDESGAKAFLAEIVDSDLDSDRIDYIWRDHVHLEMSGFERSSQIPALINSVLAIETVVRKPPPAGASIGDYVESPESQETHLYFGRQFSANIVRDLLEKRVDFYRRYYEHPVKLIADEMLVHAIYYALTSAGAVTATGTINTFADDFVYLTDDGLIGFLTDLTSQTGYEIPAAILQDFRANRNFEIVYQKSLERKRFKDFVIRDVITQQELAKLIRERQPAIKFAAEAAPLGLIGNREYESLIEDFEKIITKDLVINARDEVVSSTALAPGLRKLEYTEENDIFRLQCLYGLGFRKKIKLEKLLWHELQKATVFSNALVVIADQIARAAKVESRNVLKQLLTTPLVLITLSWIPALSDQALIAHKRGYREGDSRFHEDGKPAATNIELRIASEEEDYPLLVSAPRALLQQDGIRQHVGRVFRQLLTKRRWLLPDMLD